VVVNDHSTRESSANSDTERL